MLSQWLGRNGMDGAGGAWPIRVGLNDQNAFYDGTQVQIGHNTASQWIGSIDVVGHEMGHGIDDHTPGGISGGGTQEFVADTFGAATEWFANEPPPTTPPDFLVGEKINLVGSGPIRNMYNPSRARRPELLLQQRSRAPRCTPRPAPATTGSTCSPRARNPTNGQPASPTCNGTHRHRPGHPERHQDHVQRDAAEDHGRVVPEVPHLDAAGGQEPVPRQLHPVQHGQGRLGRGQRAGPVRRPDLRQRHPAHPPRPPPPTGGCSGQKLANPGFESGAASWTATSGVIDQLGSSQPAHGGSYKAWLDGYGSTHTDTLSQSVSIPAGCRATLTFYLHIDTAETTTTRRTTS